MKFLIAPDSFKGSLTAKAAAKAIESGLKRVYPTADYVLVPMADGGEGTVQSLVDATGGQILTVTVHDPLMRPVTAHYGLLGDGKTAVVEMAEASGLQYVNDGERNPLKTTTYGTGELLMAAAHQGVRQIIIGIGGSATTDGGAGMAQALGAKLLDQAGEEVGLGGGALADLDRVDRRGIDPEVAKVQILVASDVTNPLTGENGAAAVFGPQKGATPKMVTTLDHNLHHYAAVVCRDIHQDLEAAPGAGAAGGLGMGLLAFTNATMEKGVELVLKYSRLEQKAAGCDYAFTGEGRIDFQTKFGKTPYGVAQAVKKAAPQATVVGLAGQIGPGAERLSEMGLIDAIFATPTGAKPLDQAMKDAGPDLTTTAENIARLIRCKHC